MSILNDRRKGGNGKCRYCGQWENNVALHEDHGCPEAKRIQEAREQAYLEMLDSKAKPKPIKAIESQTLNEVVSDFLGEDKGTFPGAGALFSPHANTTLRSR